MAFRQNDLQTIRKRYAFERRQLHVWRRADLGELRTVRARARCLVIRIGLHFELIETVAEPAPRRIAQILRRRLAHAVQRNQVLFRIPVNTWPRARMSDFPPKPPMRSSPRTRFAS